jgi:hypothetical protein
MYESELIGKESQIVHYFTIPKHKFEEWKQRVRGLKASSRLCHLHFEDKNIKKGRTIQDKFYPLKRWALTDDAIPHSFTGNTFKQLFTFT